MAHGARVALYYAPELDDPLWQAGCAWLGRDPEIGATLAQPGVPGLHEATAEARAYGFHATLKPPMRLAGSYDAFLADAIALAARLPPFAMPPLAVRDLSGFLAVRDTGPSPALHALSDACVAELDHHRAPPSAEELARRRAKGLSPGREAMLQRWGYPSVFAEWRFHMTLTRRLDAAEHGVFRPAAEAFLAEALSRPRQAVSVCVFTQPGALQPFRIAARLKLGG